MAVDDRGTVVSPGGGKTISFSATFSGNGVRFVYTEPEGAYCVVEFVTAPGAPGTPLHLHRATNEAFYVLEGTLGLQLGQRTLELAGGAFVFVPKGLEHRWWSGVRPRSRCSPLYLLLASRGTSRSWPKGSRLQARMRRRP
jgi:mannose-6-phosphate isomerase-like protein (cupin superfamily)